VREGAVADVCRAHERPPAGLLGENDAPARRAASHP
jgi:hypothetical protein